MTQRVWHDRKRVIAMRLIAVSLRNFRGINEKVSVPIAKFTALAGMNNSGKSTLLEALEIFFSERAPDKDDLCRGSHDSEVEIECTFDGFPAQLVLDTQAVTNLKDEYLLSRDGLLVIRKTYNCALATPKLSGVAALCAHPSVKGCDDLISLKNTELKKGLGSLMLTSRALISPAMLSCGEHFGETPKIWTSARGTFRWQGRRMEKGFGSHCVRSFLASRYSVRIGQAQIRIVRPKTLSKRPSLVPCSSAVRL